MPYNYLIDPKIRENFKINYENSIIIFDEAHNIEKAAEDVASFEISLDKLHGVIGELSNLAGNIEHNSGVPMGPTGQARTYHSKVKNIVEIMTMTKNFQKYIQSFDIPNSNRLPISEIKNDDAVYRGHKIFDLFFEGSRFTSYAEYRGSSGTFEGI